MGSVGGTGDMVLYKTGGQARAHLKWGTNVNPVP